jgi:predicted dehydrogenase
VLSVGAIGSRNHAKRIINIIGESGLAKVSCVFHPTHQSSDLPYSNDLRDLLQCDAVFILSPNATHAEYLRYFTDQYQGYVFCEKPPVSTLKELDGLKLELNRTFFNFNLRHSLIADWLREAEVMEALGDPLFWQARVTHGLAFKPSYTESWRSDIELHPYGVVETVAIHWLDLFGYFLGNVEQTNITTKIMSGVGSACDTAMISIDYEAGASSQVVVSYAACRSANLTLQGTNGILEFSNGLLTLRSPRDTFDERGRFVEPPFLRRDEVSWDEFYAASLKRSVEYFLGICRQSETFPRHLGEASLSANRLLFRMKI